MSGMRRALVLAALLAAPLLAVAATLAVGAVTFLNGRSSPMYVNATECQGGTTGWAAWRPKFINGYSGQPAGGVYAIYASDQNPTANTCFTTSGAGVVAGQVPDVVPKNNPITTQNAVIDLGAFIAAAGKSCADDGAVVWICVQGFDPSKGNQAFSFASSAVTISTTLPPPPVITGITPAPAAVAVTWEPGTPAGAYTGDSSAYQLSAEMIASTAGASDPATHFSPMLATTTGKLGALTPTVTYAVTVTAYSKAGSASVPSAPMSATPLASAGTGDGSGGGGCASGLAGPLSLAILAGVLALRRGTRRRSR
jgi:hypothetical protein